MVARRLEKMDGRLAGRGRGQVARVAHREDRTANGLWRLLAMLLDGIVAGWAGHFLFSSINFIGYN